MSLANKRIGPYRLTQKLSGCKSYEVYSAVDKRSSEEVIITFIRLTDKGYLAAKGKKKIHSDRIKQYVEATRALNHPDIVPILESDEKIIRSKNYFYVVTPYYKDGSLEDLWREDGKTRPLSQQDADYIMHQAREAVDQFHKLGIARLNIKLSSFMIESTDNPNRPRVLLNDFLPTVLRSERFRKDEVRRKDAIAEDEAALRKMERRLNVNVGEGDQASPQQSLRCGEGAEGEGITPDKAIESTLQGIWGRLAIVKEENERLIQKLREQQEEHSKRLAIVEEEKEQIQRKLREQEEENERLMQELRKQKKEHGKRLAVVEEENERLIRDLQEVKESDTKLLAEAILVAAGAQGGGAAGAEVTAIAPPGSGTSRWTGRWLWAAGALLVLALLLAGTIFFFGKPSWAFGSSSAKVTIRQAAYELTDNYIFTGVTRSISQTKTQSIIVPATNLVLIPGRHATGTLTFHNTRRKCSRSIVVPAGTLFQDSYGISVVTDRVATVGASCHVAVPAHAAIIGPAGNIGAHDMRQTYRSIIIVDNPAAFRGGQSGQRFTTVQQSDIDNAASSLTARLKQGALDALRLQLLTGEQLVSSPVCKSNVTSDHQINDITTSLNVTVTETCSSEFYDSQEILSRSETMLNNRAQVLFGPNYALTGDINSEVTHVATDVKQGTLITVVASGLWTYQFSSARVDQLARLITGKDKQDAQSILSNQKGVQSVSINISNNDTMMPGNASAITIDYVTTLVAVKEGYRGEQKD